MLTRLITFAGSAVAVEYSGARPAKIIDFLYRHVPVDGDISPHLTFRLLTAGGSNKLRLYRDDALFHEGDSETAVAEILLGSTCYHLADRSRDGLLFHAAGLAWRGRGLLLPGTMGAGKTTLAAWLLSRGFDYLTDELVFIPQSATTMQTFTRPLNLKHPSRPVLQDQFDFSGQAAHILSSRTTDLIPHTVFKPTNALSEPPLSLIIFPRYRASSDFVLRPLSKAQAGLELMQCLINARNLPEHGFPEITRLARAVPAYQMSYANFEQVGDRIETLLRSLP